MRRSSKEVGQRSGRWASSDQDARELEDSLSVRSVGVHASCVRMYCCSVSASGGMRRYACKLGKKEHCDPKLRFLGKEIED